MRKGAFAVVVILAWCVGVIPAVLSCRSAWAAEAVSVKALVEKDSVALGEPFALQIRLEGADGGSGADQPDMSGLTDFAVEYLGGSSNNSSSITIVNGKVSRLESHGYVYSYRLTPKKLGSLVIPSIAVSVGGGKSQVLHTEPITIRVGEPEKTDDFHLDLQFSKTSFYVGEPVVLTVVWYIGKDVDSVNFNLPILESDAFAFADPQTSQDPGKRYVRIPIGATSVVAEKGTGEKNGKEYTTLTFTKVLFAKKAGTFEAPEATVSCRALVGYSHPDQNPFGGSFGNDDFFNPWQKKVFKSFVTRSRPVALTVRALPEDGKPADFTGWVGRFHVQASATPTEVNVGDPITLSISVGGSDYLDNLELPSLAKHAEIEKAFKVPEETAAGVTKGDAREFSQTLRPRSADVKAIPPIRFPYFNPDSGLYEVAQSQPISLVVKPTRVLTSADVEGEPGEGAHRKSELENWSKGISYNYEGPKILERQLYRVSSIVRSPVWMAAMLIPFFGFVLLLVVTKVRQRRMADPEGLRSRKALAGFLQRVRSIGADGSAGSSALLLDAMRSYLGDKLRSNGSALTFADIEGRLQGIDPELLDRLKRLFDACELGSYGGMDLNRPFKELVEEAIDLARSLDRVV